MIQLDNDNLIGVCLELIKNYYESPEGLKKFVVGGKQFLDAFFKVIKIVKSVSLHHNSLKACLMDDICFSMRFESKTMWNLLVFQLGKNTQRLTIDSSDIPDFFYHGLMENEGLTLEIKYNALCSVNLFTDIKINSLDCYFAFYKILNDNGIQLDLKCLKLNGYYSFFELSSFLEFNNWTAENVHLDFFNFPFEDFTFENMQLSSKLKFVKNLHFAAFVNDENDDKLIEFLTKLPQLFSNLEYVHFTYLNRIHLYHSNGLLLPTPQECKNELEILAQKLTDFQGQFKLTVLREVMYEFTIFNENEEELLKNNLTLMDDHFSEYFRSEDGEGTTQFKKDSHLNPSVFFEVVVSINGYELSEEEYQQVLWDAGVDDNEFMDDDDYDDDDYGDADDY